MRWQIQAAVFVVVAIGLGLAAFLLTQKEPLPEPSVPPTPSVGSAPTVATVETAKNLTFRRYSVETAGAQPEVCLVFSQPPLADGSVRYEDYIRFRGVNAIALRVDAPNNQICAGGLGYGRSLQVELRAGLPAAGGFRLPEAQTTTVELRDRSPLLAFGNGMLLARENSDGIPIYTVNVDRVRIKVFRAGERMLTQLDRDVVERRKIYAWDQRDIAENLAAEVWSGEMAVRGQRNENVSTLFSLRRAVAERKPGAYLIVASDAAERSGRPDEEWRSSPRSSQWVIDSDIGLTTFRGSGGLEVVARSLATAKPLGGVTVTLVSRGNEELAKTTTGDEGRASFAAGLLRGPGAAAPVAVMAFRQDDFTWLDLRRPAFDFSDRGIEGRNAPGPVDAFLYTERGIYRPGETVHLVALLRSSDGQAIPETPVTLVFKRPDGAEYRRVVAARQASGAVHAPIALGASVPRGQWSALAYLDLGKDSVGRIEFAVEDFVPQRLRVALGPGPAAPIGSGETLTLPVQASFLYGAPGAGLEGAGKLRLTGDPKPFPRHLGYRFGRHDETFKDSLLPVAVAPTDEQGRTTAVARVVVPGAPTQPLKAMVRVDMFEPGGRVTPGETSVPVRPRPLYIGLRPHFQGEVVTEGAEAAFDVIVVDTQGESAVAPALTYEIAREHTEYQWFRRDNHWQWQRLAEFRLLRTGRLAATASAPAQLRERLGSGAYRLIVHDTASGTSSSTSFRVGWYGGSGDADRPDRLDVAADKSMYQPGETARLRIRGVAAGEVMIAVATDRVLSLQQLSVGADGATIDVPVTAAWGAGAYVLVTQYRPLTDRESRVPVRAVGVAWLGIDSATRALTVAMTVPDRVLPRRELAVPVQVKGGGAAVHLTLAAVDEGILQLTRFQTPDPLRYFFGKRRLGLDMRDDYGRLIDAQGVVGEIRSGGDAIGGRGLDAVPTRTVALFSGLVETDQAGQATVRLAIPDFQGELRLMAVAVDARHVGGAEAKLIVRDAVVSDATLPRFLAPGDRSRLALSLHNLEGRAGDYRATVQASGPVQLAGDGDLRVALASAERKLLEVPLVATGIGVATLSLTLTGPDGFRVARAWPLQVRPAQLPETREDVALLQPGEQFRVDSGLLQGLVPGNAAVSINAASWRGIDVASQLRWLDRYPYGCLEQTTSRAFPLLYFNDLALFNRQTGDTGIAQRLQDAVDRVLDMQRIDGGFGWWGLNSDDADPWIGVFALDFLHQAAAKNYVVSESALQRGDAWLHRLTAAENRVDAGARAYAWLLLARRGAASLSDVRYFFDTTRGQTMQGVAQGQLGTALGLLGDRSRATAAFERSVTSLGTTASGYYRTALTDLAGLIAVSVEAGQTGLLPALLNRYGAAARPPESSTTLEKALTVLAAYELARNRAAVTVSVNGEQRTGDPVQLAPNDTALAQGITIRNDGGGPIWRTVSVEGVPSDPLPANEQGLRIVRSIRTLGGDDANIEELKQNDRIIVGIQVRRTTADAADIVLSQLLPAGLEIEAILRGVDDYNKADASPYERFLGKLSRPAVQEARDDRYVAAFRFAPERHSDGRESDRQTLNVAFIVRAVTPGDYALPAAVAEDMYRPAVRARTAMGRAAVMSR